MFPAGSSAVIRALAVCLALSTALFSPRGIAPRAMADDVDVKRVLNGVIALQAQIRSDARTLETLGDWRLGSGVVIDANGLILTIGYLILEAKTVVAFTNSGERVATTILAYDHDTGLGLLRADAPLGIDPVRIGNSTALAQGEPVLAVAFGGEKAVQPAVVMSRREFAGFWEYLLPNAIFTAPPHPAQAGAALVDMRGQLVGIGSLMVPNSQIGTFSPGNMFVPIEAFEAVVGAMLDGSTASDSRRPWLGIYTRTDGERLVVQRLAADGPASRAGVEPGDAILKVGDVAIDGMATFYRQLWAQGDAGIVVPLTIARSNKELEIKIQSASRYDWLKIDN